QVASHSHHQALEQTMKIGFVGTGIMGRPMAGHLQTAGHQLFLLKRPSSQAPAELPEGGAIAWDTAAELAQAAETVITMVPNTPDVEQVVFGPAGVAEGLTSGKILIDMSSIDPIATKAIASRIEAQG